MKNPPTVIRIVMQALCLVLYANPLEKRKNPDTLKIEIDWWAASLKLLGDTKLLQTLVEYDIDNIEDATI